MNPKRSGGAHVLGKLHDHNALPTGVKHCIAQSAGQKTMAKIGRGTASAMNPVTAAIAKQLTSCSAMSPALPAAPHESIGAKSVSAMLMSSVSNDPLHTSAQTAPVTRATTANDSTVAIMNAAMQESDKRTESTPLATRRLRYPFLKLHALSASKARGSSNANASEPPIAIAAMMEQVDAEQAIRTDRAV